MVRNLQRFVVVWYIGYLNIKPLQSLLYARRLLSISCSKVFCNVWKDVLCSASELQPNNATDYVARSSDDSCPTSPVRHFNRVREREVGLWEWVGIASSESFNCHSLDMLVQTVLQCMLGLRGHVMCYQCYVVFWPACACNCPCQHALPYAQHTRPS
jgi:hypothetical protein